MEADQNPLNPGQQEDLVLPSGEGHRYLKIQTYIFSEAKDTKICMSHLPLSPTKERMSSNVLALVAILNNNIQDDQAQKNPLTNLYLHHS